MFEFNVSKDMDLIMILLLIKKPTTTTTMMKGK